MKNISKRTPWLWCILAAMTVSTPSFAKLVNKTVSYEHEGVKLEGYFVYDDEYTGGGKKLPGILVVPEWWGVNEYARQRAQQLAGLGYAAFVADMYGAGKNTTNPKQAGEWSGEFYGKPDKMAARAEAGLGQLVNNNVVNGDKLAAIGYCFGGAVCQALAYSGAPLDGIVSFHGSLIPAPPGAARATKAKFLICSGAIDPFIKPGAIEEFKDSLETAHIDYQLIEYSGAIHAFTNPDADAVSKISGLQGIGYNANADKRSWAHMQLFFAEILK